MTRDDAIRHAARLWPRGGVLLCEETRVEIVRQPDGPYARTTSTCYVAVPYEDGIAILAEAATWGAMDWRRVAHGLASR